ncbi:hypothetical protein AALP_AA3G050000 [Arabis alpina]|uniref:Uncharacterized protein n=1 Tax=Arabis alpina TaxID=50452 RepID=A0A087H738_ARAAL|nr:hypothetical protein AALP_AA3G050000 [Arabis alpina]
MKTFLFNLPSVFFFFLVSSFLKTFVSPTQHLCHPDQRDALLEFKIEFGIQKLDPVWFSDISSYPKTESWVNKSDCCSWDGITCDAKSGQVIGLDLTASCLYGQLESNSSLYRLHHLRDLNLAYNNFNASPIPAEFDKLKGLERLNLSQTSLSGQIPTKLLQLTKLVSLDLSSQFTFTKNPLSIDESFLPLLARNLSNLRELDLSLVNISSKIPHELSNISSLRWLGFERCNLFGEFPSSVLLIPNLESINLGGNPNLRGILPNFRGNNSLQFVSLSFTSFSGSIPNSINNLIHLTSLELFGSNFSGKIPFSLGNLSHLSSLDLSNNNLVGEIPSSLGKLKQLMDFRVGYNKLSGNIPSLLLNLTQLRLIDLDSNQFTGFLPRNISQLSKLETFWASHNYFTGSFPSSLFKSSSLTDIDLDHNQLNDLVGIENLSMLPNLRYLVIGNNNYRVVDLNVFLPFKQPFILSLSNTPLSILNITTDSDFLSNLEQLYLSGCNVTKFPEFLRNQRSLQALDLSNNKIKGEVPDWLWRLPELDVVDLSNNSLSGFKGSLEAVPWSHIYTIDLSTNVFQGPLFVPSRFIQSYLASNNNFTGEIPRSMCELSSLNLLDLSNNNLHGSIPWCLEMGSLFDLNLRNNSLNGSLPDIFINAKGLRALDVSHNLLPGKLPISLRGCSKLEVLNVGNNQINDTFPFWLNSLENLRVLVLRSNKFHGALHHPQVVSIGFTHLRIIDVSHNDFTGTLRADYFTNLKAMSTNGDDTESDYLGDHPDSHAYYDSLVLMSKGIEMELTRILTIYMAVDFSRNKIHGSIPESIGLLKGLRVLNLSSNGFTGNIPSSFETLTSLESLDLSQNKLSGEIPPKLGNLHSLEWINVSHNQLVGSIPQGTQFQRQNCSSYEGNPGLDSASLKDICGEIHAPTSQQPEPLESEEEEEEWFSWVAAGIGFAPGVVFGLTIGYIVVTYKHDWFIKTFARIKLSVTRTR